MAGTVGDSFGGIGLVADYLMPHRNPCVKCGNMCLTNATADNITVTNLTVTGTTTIAYVPYIPGPDNHIWVPLGPMDIVAGPTPTEFVKIPIAVGSWFADLSLVGTGTETVDFSHSQIRFSFESTGTAVNIITTASSFQVLSGFMQTSPPTIALSGTTDSIKIDITTFENSKWVGYIKIVGAGLYGSV